MFDFVNTWPITWNVWRNVSLSNTTMSRMWVCLKLWPTFHVAIWIKGFPKWLEDLWGTPVPNKPKCTKRCDNKKSSGEAQEQGAAATSYFDLFHLQDLLLVPGGTVNTVMSYSYGYGSTPCYPNSTQELLVDTHPHLQRHVALRGVHRVSNFQMNPR